MIPFQFLSLKKSKYCFVLYFIFIVPLHHHNFSSITNHISHILILFISFIIGIFCSSILLFIRSPSFASVPLHHLCSTNLPRSLCGTHTCSKYHRISIRIFSILSALVKIYSGGTSHHVLGHFFCDFGSKVVTRYSEVKSNDII